MARYIPPPPRNTGPATATALARDAFGREIVGTTPAAADTGQSPFGAPSDQPAQKSEKATDALGRRAGALSDELDFPAFVASLMHGTFDAIVDSTIKQTQSFADLVAAVSKPLDQFTQENVTPGQARAWLVEQYPRDVTLVQEGGDYKLAPLVQPGGEEGSTPAWLSEFGVESEEFSADLLEETVLPQARSHVAQQRLSTLSTMVLLGMQRVVIKDGTIGARLRFRAAAADRAAVQYATSNDPSSGGTTWGARGNEAAITKVSTVGINAQSDSQLNAELFGDVKINFGTEQLDLDRFVGEAQRNLLERHSRRTHAPAPQAAAPAPALVPAPGPVPAPAPAPAPPLAAVAPAPQPVAASPPPGTPA